MKLKIINGSHIETITEPCRIMAIFTNLLFEETITKNSEIDKIDYKYNYPNVNITIAFKNSDLKHEYFNIPTEGDSLGISDIEKLMKGE